MFNCPIFPELFQVNSKVNIGTCKHLQAGYT